MKSKQLITTVAVALAGVFFFNASNAENFKYSGCEFTWYNNGYPSATGKDDAGGGVCEKKCKSSVDTAAHTKTEWMQTVFNNCKYIISEISSNIAKNNDGGTTLTVTAKTNQDLNAFGNSQEYICHYVTEKQ